MSFFWKSSEQKHADKMALKAKNDIKINDFMIQLNNILDNYVPTDEEINEEANKYYETNDIKKVFSYIVVEKKKDNAIYLKNNSVKITELIINGEKYTLSNNTKFDIVSFKTKKISTHYICNYYYMNKFVISYNNYTNSFGRQYKSHLSIINELFKVQIDIYSDKERDIKKELFIVSLIVLIKNYLFR